MFAKRLSIITINAMIRQAEASGRTIKKCDGSGLWFLARPTGPYWVKKFQVAGRTRDMGLGRFPVLGLAEARAQALEIDRLILKGIDPIGQRKADRRSLNGMTFKDACEQYLAAHSGAWKSADHKRQWKASLANYCKPIADKPIQAIATTDIVDLLTRDDLWATKTSTMDRVRLRIEKVIDWAIAAGHSSSSNPARWRGHLDKLVTAPGKTAKVEHMEAMPYAQVPALMKTLALRGNAQAKALAFLILTGTRTAETLGARWNEIDLEAAIWTIPAIRMKADKEHRVPLSSSAVEILNTLDRDGEFVFSIRGKDSLRRELRDAGEVAAVVHGFRSSFRDWCRDRHVLDNVAEAALAHQIKDKVERAYARSDLLEARRPVMAQWAAYLAGDAGAVIPLKRQAAAA